MEIGRVAVVGTGVMGRNIAATFARGGFEVLLVSRNPVGDKDLRLQHSMAHGAYRILDEGAADPATMDLVLKRMLGPRLAMTGLCERKNCAGVIMQAQQGIMPHLNHDRTPGPCCQQLAAEGHDGVKTGCGLYHWAGKDLMGLRRKNPDNLRRILAIASE